jgi:hypothetical protein
MLLAIGVSKIIDARFSPNNKIICIEINDSDILAALQPAFPALIKSHAGINGVLRIGMLYLKWLTTTLPPLNCIQQLKINKKTS